MLPHFLFFFLTHPNYKSWHNILISICFLIINVHHPTFWPYFGWWPAFTPAMYWYLALVDYHLLQFLKNYHNASSVWIYGASILPSGKGSDKNTFILSDALGASLDICGTILSILNCYSRIPLTKSLLSVIIKDLTPFREFLFDLF